MLTKKKSLWGGLVGVVIALIWVAFGGPAVGIVIGLGALGWLIGMILERPDILIRLLQRLQER